MLQFLKVFLDIVLWRRSPQDLPASTLLLGLSATGYVAVSLLQIALLDAQVSTATWFTVILVDPALMTAGVWVLLKFFDRQDRFLQTASAVLGAGAVLGLVLFLPKDLLVSALRVDRASPAASLVDLVLVVVFALVTGRILQLATDSNLFTGVALSLTYVLTMILLVQLAAGGGS